MVFLVVLNGCTAGQLRPHAERFVLVTEDRHGIVLRSSHTAAAATRIEWRRVDTVGFTYGTEIFRGWGVGSNVGYQVVSSAAVSGSGSSSGRMSSGRHYLKIQ